MDYLGKGEVLTKRLKHICELNLSEIYLLCTKKKDFSLKNVMNVVKYNAKFNTSDNKVKDNSGHYSGRSFNLAALWIHLFMFFLHSDDGGQLWS